MQAFILTLRFLHIVSGAIWFGAVVVMTFFIMPSIGAAGPAGGQVMKQVGDRKYAQWIMAFMGITILSGLGLMWTVAKTFGGNWFATAMGRTISLGAALAIIASTIGVVLARPAMLRMQTLGAEMAGGSGSPEQAAEMKRLQGRMSASTRIVVALMIVAVTAMAVARYL